MARRAQEESEKSLTFHVMIPESLNRRLEEAQKYAKKSSTTELLKDALKLYVAALEEHKNGGQVYFKRESDGVERHLPLFI